MEKLGEYLSRRETGSKAEENFNQLVAEKAAFLEGIHSELSKIIAAYLDIDSDSGFFQERVKALTGRYDWKKTLSDDAFSIEIFKRLLKPGYDPPNNIVELRCHIEVLYHFYANSASHPNIPPSLRDQIDFVMAKAASQARFIIAILYDAERREDHIKRINLAKSQKKEERAQPIYELFYLIDTEGMNFNRIAREIQSRLQEKYKNTQGRIDPPSIDTIKRALKSDPNTSEILKKKMIIG